jgi:flagella basal body P-ring formation protein FlgA
MFKKTRIGSTWRAVTSTAVTSLLLAISPSVAEDMRAPSPKAIIYPGDVIRDDMLVDAPLVAAASSGPVALSPDDIVGLVARRTLLPGQSIPINALAAPRVVRAGAAVKIVYIDGGLEINAVGSALQDGAVGQSVQVRNDDSGVTILGRVRADGVVQVNGG